MDFLRLIRQRNPPEYLRVTSNWKDLAFSISLLEWRAAKNVEARAEDDARNEVDASSDRRVARAVTDAYVAKQVLGFIGATSQRFSATNTSILTSLFKLVSLHILQGIMERLTIDVVYSIYYRDFSGGPVFAWYFGVFRVCRV